MKKPKLRLGNIMGPDGNAFVILGRAKAVAEEHGLDWKAIDEEATSGNYENLLAVMYKYFDVVVGRG